MRKIFLILLLLSLIIISCNGKKEETINLRGIKGVFYDQDGREFIFPDNIAGKNFLLSFIFTNCPDICPLTTHNIQAIKEKSVKNKDFIYLTITFDPARDNVFTLKTYISDRGYNTNNWYFLTGKKETTDSIMKRLSYFAFPGDTTITKSKDTLYYFTHTDKLFLIDKDLNLIEEYPGNNLDINTISKKIQKLGE